MRTLLSHRDTLDETLYHKDTGQVVRLIKSLPEQLQALEQDLIERALIDYKGNRNQAAMRLGINRTTLVEKMRKYDIHYQK